MPVTYASYLKLDELLALQQPRSEGPEHDEILFIIVHQVYELWFKELLHELDYLMRLLRANDRTRSLHTLKRILTVLKVMVAQIDILETMTPLEFLSFRDRLESGSGFQSRQFRALECVLGVKREGLRDRYPEDRFSAPGLWDAFLAALAQNGYAVPRDLLARDPTKPIEPSPALQRVLIDVYRRDSGLSQLCERLVDLDEGFMEWRYRHVKMVQRTIGTKAGTGGSAGAEYLLTTINQPAFPDLWAIRSEL
ncbi:MAG TPA: tryptophan 2,3-dioxygenase family protein [Gemmatimonadales bacterium]|jgi:tryptophan 2,3-dioxygenase|nr:tryptophan 2,3-dioxygenase family protein [Gemmatimonadales bacterium]